MENTGDDGGSKLRAELMNLHKITRTQKRQLVDGSLEDMKKICAEADELADRVKSARDNAVSAAVFSDLTEAGAKRAEKLTDNGEKFTGADLLAHMHRKFQMDGAEPGVICWKKVAAVAGKYIQARVGVTTMLGAMSEKPKVVAPRRQRARDTVGGLVVPTQVGVVGNADEINRQTDKIMEVMMRVLKDEEGPVPLVELVLNHGSFAQTVENIFTLSFMVKDKRVTFSHDDDLGTMVSWKFKVQDRGAAEGSINEVRKPNAQTILKFNRSIFEEMKSLTGPENCKMPTRPPVRDRKRKRGDARTREVCETFESTPGLMTSEVLETVECAEGSGLCREEGTAAGPSTSQNEYGRREVGRNEENLLCKTDVAGHTSKKRLVLGDLDGFNSPMDIDPVST